MTSVKKYLDIFILAISHQLKNYKSMIGMNLLLITCLIVFSHIWKNSVTKIGVIHFDPGLLLWYIAFNEWVLLSIPNVEAIMEQDLLSGRLVCLLTRPISYLGATFFDGLGILFVNLIILGIFAFFFTWWKAGGTSLNAENFIIVLLLGVLAGCVALVFQMLIGISSFWLDEVGPLNWIWGKLLFSFGGLILPLEVYPLWLQKIAYCTPFPAILGQRSALAIDFSTVQVFQVISSLLLWGTCGLGFLSFFYRRGLRILNVGGG